MNARVKAVRTALADAGYRTAWDIPAKPGERDFALTCYVGGSLGVVIVQVWVGGDREGVEVYSPVDRTNRMDALLAALKGGGQ